MTRPRAHHLSHAFSFSLLRCRARSLVLVGGHQSYTNFTGPRGAKGYFKQVYGAQGDPSINHLIIVRSGLSLAPLSDRRDPRSLHSAHCARLTVGAPLGSQEA